MNGKGSVRASNNQSMPPNGFQGAFAEQKRDATLMMLR
jgi:hypothetical protein